MKLRISTIAGIEEVSPISIDDNYFVNIGGLTCFVYFDDEDEVYRLVELNTGSRIAFGFASAQEAIDYKKQIRMNKNQKFGVSFALIIWGIDTISVHNMPFMLLSDAKDVEQGIKAALVDFFKNAPDLDKYHRGKKYQAVVEILPHGNFNYRVLEVN